MIHVCMCAVNTLLLCISIPHSGNSRVTASVCDHGPCISGLIFSNLCRTKSHAYSYIRATCVCIAYASLFYAIVENSDIVLPTLCMCVKLFIINIQLAGSEKCISFVLAEMRSVLGH